MALFSVLSFYFNSIIWSPPGFLTSPFLFFFAFLFCFLPHRHTHSLGLLAATRSEKIAVRFNPQRMEALFSGCWQLNQPASHWWVSDYFQSASQYVSAVIECQYPYPVFSWPSVMAFLFCLVNDIWNNSTMDLWFFLFFTPWIAGAISVHAMVILRFE